MLGQHSHDSVSIKHHSIHHIAMSLAGAIVSTASAAAASAASVAAATAVTAGVIQCDWRCGHKACIRM